MNWDDIRLNDPHIRSRLRCNDPRVEQLTLDFGYSRGSDFEYGAEGRVACESDGLLVGHCTALKRLRLASLYRGSAFNDEEMVGFETVLRGISNNRSVEELAVDGYGGSTRSGAVGSRAPDTFSILSPLFEHNHNLRRLHLCFRAVGTMFPKGNAQLFAAIGKCGSLTDVEFNACTHHSEEYGGQFIAALKNSKNNLTKLSLKGCYHSWNGCSDLEDLIRHSLEELDLTENDIDDEGAALLGRVLGEGTTLKTLAMYPSSEEGREGRMTVAGWTALFACLQSPDCALEKLQLRYFESVGGALALADALVEENTSLTTIKMKMASLSREGWRSFFTKLFQGANSALEHLDVSRSDVGEEEMERLDGHEIASALAKALQIPKIMALKTLNLTQFWPICKSERSTESWGAITSSVRSRIFNAESLSSVMASNHSVAKLYLGTGFPSEERPWLSDDLESLLHMNANANKAAVVGEKVNLYYNTCNPNVEDDELLLSELRNDSADLQWNKVMPFVVAWAGGYVNPTLLNRIFRRMPTIFGSVGGMSATRKRKATI